MKHSLQPLPRLERLLIDTDVNPLLARYLRAVAFNVLFAAKVRVDYRDDISIIKWARKHRRIVVTHDRYKDRATKIRACQEIYDHGGQVIQVSRGQDQTPLTSLGKILAHREDWVKFFQENDGMVLVHKTGMTPMPRAYLIRQIQNQLDFPALPKIAPKSPHIRKGGRRPKPISEAQSPLL